jgi:Leucine-rich repeat (LRR) protein
LKELNLLNFNNNLVTELKNGTFLNLKKLKTLIFSNNKITGFPDIFETFENCLELLHFQNNFIKELPSPPSQPNCCDEIKFTYAFLTKRIE